MNHPRLPPGGTRAFSLVEVILAVGILSVALLTMIALHSSLHSRRGEISSLRHIFDSASSLEVYLQRNAGIGQVRLWVANGPKRLIHVGNGIHDEARPGVDSTGRGWLNPAGDSIPALDADRRLVLAVLEAGDPPATAAAIPGALVVRASFYPAPTPDFQPPATTPPSLVTLLTVLR